MSKRLTDMIWRAMGQGLVFSLVLSGLQFYVLSMYLGFPSWDGWHAYLVPGLTALAIALSSGVLFGYWMTHPVVARLDRVKDIMVYMEKGDFAPEIPFLGEDEIGRLAQHLAHIRALWKEQVHSLQRLSSHNAELAAQVRQSAIAEERQRLARELHDAVSQQLFAISMTATAVARSFDQDPDRARQQIRLIEEMASVAQSEMRALLLHLRPVHLEGKHLAQALIELLQEFRAKLPLDIVWRIDETLRLPPGIEEQLFRIAQEALSNVLRHAKATRLEVALVRRPRMVRLQIQDNGVGFDSGENKHASYGLSSIRERVHTIGGTFHLVTAPGQGTRIDVRIPLLA
ncbi:HAMP domain-containing sensor histidine kinase [Kyrpidia tusciae]|uniref:Sensor histidine kinase n=1 Tax=Kyrpidia tusciae (strain DSM 2912 / NBRC 15312 / T2) TaxID=562970 RepID=D5WY44_KYRT2|nr:sensor histidine kinase [Kyrpidia tusciae]ADG06103.1 integral membrane sensor signal transduction histidine kinase [Kyrpidia tusciae DSM 2912]